MGSLLTAPKECKNDFRFFPYFVRNPLLTTCATPYNNELPDGNGNIAEHSMNRKTKSRTAPDKDKKRVELGLARDAYQRALDQAKRYGLTLAGYIMQGLMKTIEADEARDHRGREP